MKVTKPKDIWSKKTPPAKNVTAFIQASPKQTRTKLQELRKIIRDMVPEAEEVISYKMPVYKYRGKMFAGFAGFKEHVGFYGMSGTFLDTYRDELKAYETSKGTIRFPLDKPLPVTLIKKLLRDRLRGIEQS